MFGILGEVIYWATVTHNQIILQTTPSTTKEYVEILQARGNGLVNQIGQTQLPLSFGLANFIQFVNSCNSKMKASYLATYIMHTLASKVWHIFLFTMMELSSQTSNRLKFSSYHVQF